MKHRSTSIVGRLPTIDCKLDGVLHGFCEDALIRVAFTRFDDCRCSKCSLGGWDDHISARFGFFARFSSDFSPNVGYTDSDRMREIVLIFETKTSCWWLFGLNERTASETVENEQTERHENSTSIRCGHSVSLRPATHKIVYFSIGISGM